MPGYFSNSNTLKSTFSVYILFTTHFLSLQSQVYNLLCHNFWQWTLRVRDQFETFGVFLLNDKDGDRMAIIKEESRGTPINITMEVLREWLAGKGVEVSWESLISTLRNSKLPLIAEQIQMALDKLIEC